MSEISLSTTEFRALSSESRAKILKLLNERNYTLSELAAKTGMAAPTIKQHTSILVESGLIELKDEGRKWKYYSLTRKGKEILDAKKPSTNILIVLSTTAIIAFIGVIFILQGAGQYSIGTAGAGENQGDQLAAIMPAAENTRAIGAGNQEPNVKIEAPSMAATRMEENPKCRPLNDINSETDAFAQSCYASQTKEECERIDNYNAITKTAGEKDSVPDCKWATT